MQTEETWEIQLKAEMSFSSPLPYSVIAAHVVQKGTHCSGSRLREGTVTCDAQVWEDKREMMFQPNFGVFLISLILNESFSVTLAGLAYKWVSLWDFFFCLCEFASFLFCVFITSMYLCVWVIRVILMTSPKCHRGAILSPKYFNEGLE